MQGIHKEGYGEAARDIELAAEDETTTTKAQLERDMDHLRKLRRGLERTIDLIHRANRAYLESKDLLDGEQAAH